MSTKKAAITAAEAAEQLAELCGEGGMREVVLGEQDLDVDLPEEEDEDAGQISPAGSRPAATASAMRGSGSGGVRDSGDETPRGRPAGAAAAGAATAGAAAAGAATPAVRAALAGAARGSTDLAHGNMPWGASAKVGGLGGSAAGVGAAFGTAGCEGFNPARGRPPLQARVFNSSTKN